MESRSAFAASIATLGDTRALAGAATQIIQLGTTHDALADDGRSLSMFGE
jgi:hypothetical protein